MVEKFYLRYLDVESKWVDDTKTTIELMVHIQGFGDIVLTHVHTDDDIETCKQHESEIIEILLNVIRENVK